MRLLLWSPNGSGLHYHGPAIATYRMYSLMDRARHELDLAHGYVQQPLLPEVFRRQVLIGPFLDEAADRTAQQQPWRLRRRQLLFIARAWRWLARSARDYDVMHGIGGLVQTLLPAIFARRAGLPVVLTPVIEGEAGPSGNPAVTALRRALYGRADRVVAISSEIATGLIRLGVAPERIVRIPMAGVDTKLFRPVADAEERAALRTRLGVAELPTIIFAGSLVRRKRPHWLIEALGQGVERGQPAQLLLAGPEQDPAYAAEMRAQANALGVADRVHWLGFRTDMPEIFRSADVFALPSEQEGMPGAMLEAMASGLPPVLPPVSGVGDAVTSGRNGLITPADAKSFGHALLDLLADGSRTAAWGMAARTTILEGFTAASCMGRYLELFDGLTERAAGRPAADSIARPAPLVPSE